MKKSFTKYLIESEKSWPFKIRLAVEPTAEVLENIRNAIEAYGVDKLSKTTKLPMQDYPADFPEHGPIEVYVLDAVMSYPCTTEQLATLIHERAGIDRANFIVRTAIMDSNSIPVNLEKTGKSLLTQDLEDVDNKSSRTDNQLEMLKDLESIKYEFAAKSDATGKTTNDLPQGNTSTLGTHKPKLPPKGKAK